MMFYISPILIAQEPAEMSEQPSATPEVVISQDKKRDLALEKQIIQGQAKWLTDGKDDFLAIYNANETASAIGGLLIVTAPSETVLTSGVIKTSRDYFPSVDWHVLAIHPVDLDFSVPMYRTDLTATDTKEAGAGTENNAEKTIPDTDTWYKQQAENNRAQLLKRLLPAEKELLTKAERYVLVARSVSAELALDAVIKQNIKPMGIILLNIDHPVAGQEKAIAEQLAKIDLPILDIYDTKSRAKAEKRKRIIRKPYYSQKQIPAMDGSFRGAETLVTKSMRAWLQKNFKMALN